MKTELKIYNSQEFYRVPTDCIVYVHSDGNYCDVYLVNDEHFTVTMNLQNFGLLIESQLQADAQQFLRIGKTLIVNRNYIYYINPNKKEIKLAEPMMKKIHTLKASKDSLHAAKAYLES